MCGIAAIHGSSRPDPGRRMLARIGHRGPDGRGEARVGEHAWLGHARLAIVDLDTGAQPLRAADGGAALAGNGEVYNHAALRAELPRARFRTRSDNEAALALIEERGAEALHELRGMFAFLYAAPDGAFLAARDPVGIKPLYYATRGGETRFASELGAFDEDWQPLVRSFPPGHFWTPERGFVRFARAVPGGAPPALPDDREDVLDLIRDRLAGAVRERLMGDVPVGVFLSGGLDSSLVAAIAAREVDEPLQTFAVGLAGSPDLEAARQVAEHLGTVHRERVYTPAEALRALPEVIRSIESFDPSLVRSAVANHLLAEHAARHVKVVLTGEGADELFAGYEHLHCEHDDEDALHDELVRMVSGLHELNLQRTDRTTMAHGLEARVPFLALEMIELGLAIPARWKLGRPEKRLLREAFRGWLPEPLLWRAKAQFGDGSGAAGVLRERMAASVTAADLAREADAVHPPLRSREELAYYRIFAERFGGIRPHATIGRFATT